MKALLDAVVFDIGGTLVTEADPGTPVGDLVVEVRRGAVDDLSALAAAGLAIGAATNTAVMPEAEVRALLVPSGLADLLPVIATSSDAGADKPDPAVLHLALERLGVADPARVLYVGDRDIDVTAAAAAGMPFAPIGDGPVMAAVMAWIDRVTSEVIADAVVAIRPVDVEAERAATELQDRLTKPRGALGRLESLGIRLAALAGEVPPPVPHPAAVAVFAGDHGVLAQGVTQWPQEVTGQMVANFLAGGAAINVLAGQVGAEVVVVDMGVAGILPAHPGLLDRKVRAATWDLADGPAMTVAEAGQAVAAGIGVARLLVERGARCLVTGDMGIGNTTPSAALIAAFTGRPAAEVTGRGTGIDDPTLARKVAVIERALTRVGPGDGPLAVLAEVGGFEIAGLAGFILGGAAAGVPMVTDGVIAMAALLTASRIAPTVLPWCIAGHRSVEPGATVALAHLDLEPLLDLGLRLGEGTGAVLALPMVQAAARILGGMATFDAAGVVEKEG
ncbi:MAG TPA: nicotinate-nucleotide--dimethylbenzimidazole phosphoribosyltransferase [Acidimicrobiales bacterium]|jgi:nicotinate-nucleotide--dimethylbenzimidazole phosphoribosyltransferase|nr:nicotinate-nucleotide--dimethylbenzimidazole phosphoribosyltransferase [Acidimicrobiales bacterium]